MFRYIPRASLPRARTHVLSYEDVIIAQLFEAWRDDVIHRLGQQKLTKFSDDLADMLRRQRPASPER